MNTCKIPSSSTLPAPWTSSCTCSMDGTSPVTSAQCRPVKFRSKLPKVTGIRNKEFLPKRLRRSSRWARNWTAQALMSVAPVTFQIVPPSCKRSRMGPTQVPRSLSQALLLSPQHNGHAGLERLDLLRHSVVQFRKRAFGTFDFIGYPGFLLELQHTIKSSARECSP